MMEIKLKPHDILHLRMALNDGIKWRDSLAQVYEPGERERDRALAASRNYKKLLRKLASKKGG